LGILTLSIYIYVTIVQEVEADKDQMYKSVDEMTSENELSQ